MDTNTTASIVPSLAPIVTSGDRVIVPGTHHNSHPRDHKLNKKIAALELVFNHLMASLSEEPQQAPEFLAALRTLKVSNKSKNKKKLTRFIEDALQDKQVAIDDLVKLSIAILKLKTDKEIRDKIRINITLNLINKIITQRRVVAQNAYAENMAQIAKFRQVYKLTFTDSIFRYAIGFNAGLGSGSVIYGIATALLLNPIVMAVSGGISLIVCVVIATYFLKSYNEEDVDLTTKLNNFEKTIQLHAAEEAALRLECYDLVNQMAGLITKVDAESLEKIKGHKHLLELHKTKGDQDPLAMDTFINLKLKKYSKEISTVAQVNNIQESKPTSIYSRIFHSKHWGPVLNFFGATGTLFGVTKTILALVGITALASSPFGLVAVVAGAAIVFSLGFAYKHWRFNKLSEKRNATIKDFEKVKMDGLTINTDKLKKLKSELQTRLQTIKHVVNNDKFKQADKQLALDANKLTETKPNYRNQPSSPTASPSNSGIFSLSQRSTDSVSKSTEDFRPQRLVAVKH